LGRSRFLVRSNQSVSLCLHGFDLLQQHFEAIQFAADLRLEKSRQGAAIASPQILEPLAPVTA